MIKKLCFLFISLICSTSIISANECISYSKKGNQVIFNCKDGSKLSLTINSSSVVKVWFDQLGKFSRQNPSFAIVNDQLENVSDISVNEEPSAYEIFTSKLRIRVNKNPMQLQIFDKYQKLVFSDYNDKGNVPNGKGKIGRAHV